MVNYSIRVTDRTEPVEVVFLDRATLPGETRVRPLGFAHRLVVHESTAPTEVADRIAGAQIVITNKAPIRADAIAAAPRLRLVAVAATGTDVVDLAACAARGVSVCNIRNYAVHTVPEHSFALILALRRSILAYRDSVRNGRWQESGQFCFFDHPIHDLAGATLGIIGDGVLAIFPVVGDAPRGACDAALRTVAAARAGMAHLDAQRRAQGLPPLPFGVALHLGEILWGNIGAADRLDFTAIGPAVNLVSRLEGLCRPLERAVLISGALAAETEAPLLSLGSHALRGITAPCAVFTVPES